MQRRMVGRGEGEYFSSLLANVLRRAMSGLQFQDIFQDFEVDLLCSCLGSEKMKLFRFVLNA